MKLKFRSVQTLTLGTMFGYWLVRFLSDSHHAHISMLVMGAVAAALSELGYRAGRKEPKKVSVRE